MTRIRITIGIMTRLATDCSLTRSHCRPLHSSSSSSPSPHTRRRKVKRKMMILDQDDDHDYPPHTKRRKRRRKMMTRIRMTIRMRTKITSDFISTQLSTPHLLFLHDACSRGIWWSRWSSVSESKEFDDQDCSSTPPFAAVLSHQCGRPGLISQSLSLSSTSSHPHPELNSDQIVVVECWFLVIFFVLLFIIFAVPSSDQICQEKYPLRGWKSMKFQIQSQPDKMSLLAYLAWIEHSSGGACLPLIWSVGLSLHQGPLTQGLLSPTDNLSKSPSTKPNVWHSQKKSIPSKSKWQEGQHQIHSQT